MKFHLLFIVATLFIFTQVSAQTTATATSEGATAENKTVDSLMCKQQLSLYREYHKIKQYALAFPHWRWMFYNCPKATQNIYIDGIKILDDQINKTQDAALRDKLVDTLLMVYDQRIVYYNREGYVLGRKAIDAIEYKPALAEQAFPWFKKSIELQGNQSEGAVLVYYLTTAVKLANEGKIDKSEIFTVYDIVITITDFNVSKAAGDEKSLGNWMKVKMNIESIIEPLASCTELVKIYEKKFKENPADIQMLKSMTAMLDKRNCTTESDLFFRATEKLHSLEPSAQSAYLMGRLCIQNNQLSKAADYMSQAADLYETNDDKIKALYALAGVHTGLKNYSQARATAYKILQLNPNEGKAYIIIGDLYAMSAGMCDADDLGGKTVFWVAVDKYLKAKSVDNSVETQANEKISQYSRYYPATTDLFFRSMDEGSSYTVGCWINETTTIRGIK